MVRLWTLEAMAHGAELTCYFRWRQFPQAQEQHHAGLLRPDSVPAPGLAEAAQAGREIAALGEAGSPCKQVALVFDYQAEWVTAIQPQGAGLSALWAAFACYSALRQLGLDVDILSPDAKLDGYALVVVPSLPIAEEAFAQRLAAFPGAIVIGPRSGSRTAEFAIPTELAPGPLQRLLPAKVELVESLPPGVEHLAEGWRIARWLEHLETEADPEFVARDGAVAAYRHGRVRYLAAWPENELALAVLRRAAEDAGLTLHTLPDGVRLRRAGTRTFAFNYAAEPRDLPETIEGELLLGERALPPAGVAVLG
jgi:beta-galactosidase